MAPRPRSARHSPLDGQQIDSDAKQRGVGSPHPRCRSDPGVRMPLVALLCPPHAHDAPGNQGQHQEHDDKAGQKDNQQDSGNKALEER